MSQSRREKIHDITRDEIKEAARKLTAEKGSAGLSVRAIARQMGMTAPALYHYYASLNDIITALIQDGFARMADTLEAAAADTTLETTWQRLSAVANAQRQWALDHPVDFQLLYGNPIPNYIQPTEITYPEARRSFLVTAKIITEAIENGEIETQGEYLNLPSTLEDALGTLRQVDGHDLPYPALVITASAWSRIHGLIMLELFHLIQPVIADVDTFFTLEIQAFLKQIGCKLPE